MKRLTIGIDIDGVIVDYATAMLPVVSDVCGRPVSVEDLRHWDLRKALDIDNDEHAYIWEQILETDLLRHARPIEGAISGLLELSRHDVWLVTARPSRMQDLTESWLAENNAKHDHLVLGRYGDKLLAGDGFDVFVEDYLEEARAIAEGGVLSILLDQPWNQAAALPDNCYRVFGWESIIELIGRLEEEQWSD